jgi:nitrogen regulatory protein PII 2
MVTVIVPDEAAEKVVSAIIEINSSGQFGDGKLFVSTIEEARRIRTGELGEVAVA